MNEAAARRDPDGIPGGRGSQPVSGGPGRRPLHAGKWIKIKRKILRVVNAGAEQAHAHGTS